MDSYKPMVFENRFKLPTMSSIKQIIGVDQEKDHIKMDDDDIDGQMSDDGNLMSKLGTISKKNSDSNLIDDEAEVRIGDADEVMYSRGDEYKTGMRRIRTDEDDEDADMDFDAIQMECRNPGMALKKARQDD